jgi:hypothetical protein
LPLQVGSLQKHRDFPYRPNRGERKLGGMTDNHPKPDNPQPSEERRQGPTRSGEDRRKVNIPPPPGSPVRTGTDRRKNDRRGNEQP